MLERSGRAEEPKPNPCLDTFEDKITELTASLTKKELELFDEKGQSARLKMLLRVQRNLNESMEAIILEKMERVSILEEEILRLGGVIRNGGYGRYKLHTISLLLVLSFALNLMGASLFFLFR